MVRWCGFDFLFMCFLIFWPLTCSFILSKETFQLKKFIWLIGLNIIIHLFHFFVAGSKEILVLVQNVGEKNLSVDLSGSNHRDDALLEIPKHGSKQV